MIIKKNEPHKLRICHFNILKGGEKRLKNISKVIENINPDICGILESVGSKNEIRCLQNMGKDLGYNLFDIAIANSKYNIAIFSKLSLTIKVIQKGVQHVILKGIIENGPFKNLSVFFIHLSPVSEDARLLEINKLLKYTTKVPQAIIMGDFNSLSEHDPYNQKKLLNIFQKNNIIKYGTKKLRFDVIKEIELSGLIDATNYLKYPYSASTPTLSNKDINHIANIRIDYAFLTKNIIKYLKRVEIVKNKHTEIASDHYPLFIDLKK